jgi:hypothetical protein
MATVLLAVPCWVLFAIVVMIAWPIWHYANEFALFQRRALLASVALEDSAIRRWFWRGRVAGLLHAFDALLWAAVLLVSSALLRTPQWLLLALDAAVFAAMIPFVRRRLASQIREEHVAAVARRWPLQFGNVALLALGFFVIDFFIAGAPDTRGLAWLRVAENAFDAYAGASECAVAGVLIGLANVVDVLTWHASQVLIPSLPRIEVKLAAWLVVLLKASIVSWAFTRLLLGLSAMVEAATLARASRDARSEFPKEFAMAVIVVGVALFAVAAAVPVVDPTALPGGVRHVVAWTNPCRAEAKALSAVQPALRADVDRARVDASQRAAREVDEAVGALFATAEQKVDAYLDWYFSVLGEYQRLGAAVFGDFPARMRHELDRRILGELHVDQVLDDVSRRIAGETVARFEQLVADLGEEISHAARAKPCLTETIDGVALRGLDRDRFRASIAASGGIVAAIAVRALAARAASAMAARLAARQAFSAAVNIGGKVATRRAGTMTLAIAAASACAPGGPLAAVCAVVAGAVSWLAIDYGLVKIDEMRFRDQMRAEILDAVRTAERQLADDLKAQHQAIIDQLAAKTAESVDRVFVPARQGL